jgi:ankyrin repeat protein
MQQDGNTALMEASEKGRTAIVQALIKAGADCTVRNEVLFERSI